MRKIDVESLSQFIKAWIFQKLQTNLRIINNKETTVASEIKKPPFSTSDIDEEYT